MNGVITDDYLPPITDADNSWVKLFKGINDKYNAGPALRPHRCSTATRLAYTATQALLEAGEDPTRESLVEAMEKGGFEGPSLAPYAYSDDDHSGIIGVAISKIANEEAEVISKVFTTDDGDGPVEETDDAPFEAPSSGMPE